MDVRELVAVLRDFGFPVVVALLLLLKLDATLRRVHEELHAVRTILADLLHKLGD